MPAFLGLPEGVIAEVVSPERLETTYVDTKDLRLARWGVSLRHRLGQGWTLKLPDQGGGDLRIRPEYEFKGDPTQVPAAAADLITAFARGAKLDPVARLRTVRRRARILDASGVLLVEVADDEVSVLSAGRLAARFREVEAEMGPDTPMPILEAVVQELRRAGAGPADAASKYLRAVGPRALEPPDVVRPDLPDAPTPRDVLRLAIASGVTRLIEADPVARIGEDPEGVHQMRVAARNLHSQLGTFAALADPAWEKPLGKELGWLARALGGCRDADVMLEHLRAAVGELPERDREVVEAAGLLGDLEANRKDAHRRTLRILRSDRYVALLDRLVDAAAAPVLNASADGSLSPLIDLVEEQRRALRSRIKAVGVDPSAKDLHRIRVEAKRCRYATEVFIPVFHKQARSFARAAIGLQTVLGDLNDAVVMEMWIRSWAQAPGRSPEEAFVAGQLVARQRVRATRAHARWPRAWKAITKAERPRTWR